MIDKKVVLKNFIEQKEMIEDKVFHGIETNRKGYCKINFVTKEGNQVFGAKIKIKQKTHDFKFGANIFKLGCFQKDKENAKYEELFKKLFNYATVPFYWDAFEPEDGKMRFDKNSVFIDRRPPSDLVVEFCQKNNIQMKGHCLFWALMMPQWLPNSYEKIKPYVIRRLKAIAQKYDGIMESFDIVNEMTDKFIPYGEYNPTVEDNHKTKCIRGDYTEWVFRQSDKFFDNSKFNINETGSVWDITKKEASKYYLMIDNLIKSGCRMDGIGMQYHMFFEEDKLNSNVAGMFDANLLYRAMDLYGQFGKKLQMSEISVFGYDEELQAELIKTLYKIWFSHKDVESITYWNIGDNTAIKTPKWDETGFKFGIFGDDFRIKPAYEVLDQLINHEWKTNIECETSKDHYYFNAYYGKYDIEVICNGNKVVREIEFIKDGSQEYYFEV